MIVITTINPKVVAVTASILIRNIPNDLKPALNEALKAIKVNYF
jgi:hypothetical protein